MLTQKFKDAVLGSVVLVIGLGLAVNQYMLTRKVDSLEHMQEEVLGAKATPTPTPALLSKTPTISISPVITKLPLQRTYSTPATQPAVTK